MNDFFDVPVFETNENIKSLSGNSYTDPEIFKRERFSLFRYFPIIASPECLIPNKGNYTVVDIASESIIVVKDKEGEINAMANTCRHRGKKLLESNLSTEPQKGLKSIVCPYHAWRYDLEGKLVMARGSQSESSYRNLCLRKLNIQESAGLVFYHGNDNTFPQVEALDKVLGSLQLKNAKVSERKNYVVNANWKLWSENFLECWHCAPNHPELSEVKGFINQFETGREDLYMDDDVKWRTQAKSKGWSPPKDLDFESDDDLFHFHVTMPLGTGKATASKSGKRMGATLGNAEGLEGGAIFGCLGPLLFYMAYVDYVVLFCVRPKTAIETHIEVFWLTSTDFHASIEELTWLWSTTLQQDTALVEETQQGVNSLYYTPGPFQEDEYRTRGFVAWWRNWEERTRTNK